MEPVRAGGQAGPERDPRSGPFGAVLSRIETLANGLAAVSLIVICVYVVLGIVLRNLSLGKMPDESVIVADLMLAVLTLPLASVAADRSFIAVEVFTDWMGAAGRRRLAILALIVAMIAVLPIIYSAAFSLIDAIESGNYYFGLLRWPEWPGRLIFFVAYLVFSVRLIGLFLSTLSPGPRVGG
ncbi:TRAP transporter small permease subunit [Paracoccus sp. (in: a-proteobacteria)]|uniref:TRAP transporter small permease subunit n=1 Tax=Paracoccus sp. TaxID=267 RepID=UPI003A8C2ABC